MTMARCVDECATLLVENRGMIRERLTTIWSLRRRAEVSFRIFYRVHKAGGCRVFHLERVEELAR